MIQGLIKMFSVGGIPVEVDEYDVSDNFFDLDKYEEGNGEGLEQILAGLMRRPSLMPNLSGFTLRRK